MNSIPIVQMRNVIKKYPGNGQAMCAVRDVTLDVSPGELTLLLGPSGSGKTTVLNLIAGLLEPTSGIVTLFGKSLADYPERDRQHLRAAKIGFIFQTFMLIDALTVFENIALVRRFGGGNDRDGKRVVSDLLEALQIGHLAERYPASLSQGEKQRVAVARAIVNNCPLLLADEPTASVESSQGLQIIEMLHTLAKERNICVVAASHDLRIIPYADRSFKLIDGKLTLDQCPENPES